MTSEHVAVCQKIKSCLGAGRVVKVLIHCLIKLNIATRRRSTHNFLQKDFYVPMLSETTGVSAIQRETFERLFGPSAFLPPDYCLLKLRSKPQESETGVGVKPLGIKYASANFL